MKTIKLVNILIAAIFVLAACTPAGGGELKIAILAPLSGAVPTFGEMTRDGALLAIEQWNANGGVLGMTIVPIVEDSQCTPDPAVNAANKVINQDGVHYIIGEVCSKASIPISEIATPAQVIQISPTSTNPSVTVDANGVTKDFIFRACFIDPFQGLVGAKFAYENLGARNAFVMIDQANDYVKGLAENFKTSFTELGGTIVGEASYTANDTDFSAIVTQIQDANPDIVYLPDYYNIVNLVTQQAKDKGLTVPFLGGDGWDSADLNVVSAAGGYFTNHYSPDSEVEIAVNFRTAFEEKYGKTPDALAALAFDATNLLLTAIQNAGEDDTTLVAEALEAISFDAVSGTITFDDQHNPIKSATIIAVTEEGVTFEAMVNP